MTEMCQSDTTTDAQISPAIRVAELELDLERIKQNLEDISRMGAVLTSITDLEEVLSVLMQMALRVIGAEVGLIMTDGPGGPTPKIVWGFEADAVSVLQCEDGRNVVEWVMTNGEGASLDFSEHTNGLEYDGRRLMVGGVLCLPIKAKLATVGCVLAVNKIVGGPFTDDDHNALQRLVDFAGVAIENSRLFKESLEKQRLEQELSVAEEVQQTLVPSVDFDFPGITIKSLYRPAGRVGGDYFDFIPRGKGQFVLVIGDVSSKGVPAALVMTAVRSIVRSEALRSDSTAEVVSRINDLISKDLTGTRDMFVTFWYGLFDLNNGRLKYTNAGHEPPLLYKAQSASIVELRDGGVFLGQFPGSEFAEGEVELALGDRFITCTDGVIEAADADCNLFGRERFRQTMEDGVSLEPEEFLENLRRDVEENFNNADFIDDMTVVFARIDRRGTEND